ncbi:MAG: hypothetical protein ABSB00_00290 [Minisyncoccia bacterium]|jgi:hypothetical protein
MTKGKEYQAVVGKIIHNGKYGPYAVAHSQEMGSVTFSLNPEVWQEEDWPEPGMRVVLSQVREKSAGWRAKHARFTKPPENSNTN